MGRNRNDVATHPIRFPDCERLRRPLERTRMATPAVDNSTLRKPHVSAIDSEAAAHPCSNFLEWDLTGSVHSTSYVFVITKNREDCFMSITKSAGKTGTFSTLKRTNTMSWIHRLESQVA